jgi:FtsH-binding integral membrane protein
MIDSPQEKALKKHLSLTSSYLMMALLICGAAAFLISKWKGFMEFYANHQWLMFFATFIPMITLLIYLAIGTKNRSDHKAFAFPLLLTAFITFAALMGLTLSPIFLIYTNSSIFATFFVSALIFGLAAVAGVTVKRDLSGWGMGIFLGMIGISIISCVNYFLGSKPIDYIIGIIGVILFTACAMYDFNKIKNEQLATFDENKSGLEKNKNALFDAIDTFLTFVNLFLHLLKLMGENKSAVKENLYKINANECTNLTFSNADDNVKFALETL